METPRFAMRLPAHVLNGIAVSLGVSLIQIGLSLTVGQLTALAAATGAICASMADLPLAPARTWRRVGLGALMACVSGLLVNLLRESGVAMGLTIIGLSFCSTMTLAWGLRAGPLSFIPILALIFTLAAPPPPDAHALWIHAGWTAFGALAYFGWALLCARVLQPRYRTLALAAALQALAALLRSRAALLSREPAGGPPPLQDWIRSQVTLDERLQAARDLLYPMADESHAAPAIAVLLQAIEMRDTLLAGELDVELLGNDAAANQLRERVRANGVRVADAIAAMAQALIDNGLRMPVVAAAPSGEADAVAATMAPLFAETDPRYPLAVAFYDRARQIAVVLARMQAALRGEPTPLPLAHDELQVFISPEGWPLAALRAQLDTRSPTLRHAVRLSLALGSAYFIGLALPWASHPHWLVLSVSVVLRGNLEQTLSRRNDRVLGTMIGCLLVLLLAQIGQPWLTTAAFLVAVGISHSFITARYLVTAAAASVMALMQAHMVAPEVAKHFGVFERAADTVMGAALAWGFSYLWPWWERRGIAKLNERVLKSLRALAVEVMRLPDPARRDLQLRLARREVYEAIGAIASTAQRTGVEPESVQVPMYALAEMLTRCHVLMAQLAAVRLLLARRRAQLDAATAQPVLDEACAELHRALVHPEAGGPPAVAGGAVPREDVDRTAVPAALPDSAVLPWLGRRLRLATRAAQRVGLAAQALDAAAR